MIRIFSRPLGLAGLCIQYLNICFAFYIMHKNHNRNQLLTLVGEALEFGHCCHLSLSFCLEEVTITWDFVQIYII